MLALKDILLTNASNLDGVFYRIYRSRDAAVLSLINELDGKYSKDVEDAVVEFFENYYEKGFWRPKKIYQVIEVEDIGGWMTYNCYYVCSEPFHRDYMFETDEYKFEFLVVYADIEKNYTREIERRYYKLVDVRIEGNNVIAHFIYEKHNDNGRYKQTWDMFVNEAVEKIYAALPKKTKNLNDIIRKHVRTFAKRKVQDFLIVKDLSNFLTVQLDYYLKGKLTIDEINNEKIEFVKDVKTVCSWFIDILSAHEEQLKNIWEAKPYIKETHYVITFDRIEKYAGTEFLVEVLEEVMKNQAQLEEYKQLIFPDKTVDEIREMIREWYENLKQKLANRKKENKLWQ